MRKYITFIIALTFALASQAQTMNVHFKNGTKVEFSSETVDYVDFTAKPSDPTLTPGEYVDLGLSVKWAACNLGATKPSEAGGYYAWGETSTKEKYSQETYAYYREGIGYTDIGEDISGTTYDATTVNLGKDWRMPTKDEMQELLDKCTWTFGQQDGVKGYFVTGKNGNSIFLPLAGYMFDNYCANPSNVGSHYISSTSYDFNDNNSYFLWMQTNGKRSIFYDHKYYGFTIRPVYSPSSSTGIENITDYISIARTGISTIVTGSGTLYKVTFEITNKSSESVHLTSLAGVSIGEELEGGKSYTITLQSSTAALQNYKQTLVFTYNGKSYSVKG